MFDTHFGAWVWRIERPNKVLILVFVLGSGRKKKKTKKTTGFWVRGGKTKHDLVFRLGSRKKAKQNIACAFEVRSGEQKRPNKIMTLVFGPLILVSGKEKKKIDFRGVKNNKILIWAVT